MKDSASGVLPPKPLVKAANPSPENSTGIDIVPTTERAAAFGLWLWASIPLLAIAAYAPALRVGFLADDLILLNQAQASGINLGVFLPLPGYFLYRPVGSMLTWQLGWQLWGFNALPFHIISLLLYAGMSMLLGLWVASVSSDRRMGWLAGALFAVFPLHLEATAWIAAQWDLWAAFFGVLSLWLFARWLQTGEADIGRARLLYVSSLLSFFLGVFSKESLTAFFPLFIMTAWLIKPSGRWAYWKKVAPALVPFAGVRALNIGLRLLAWGSVGGYQNARTNYLDFAWDAIIDVSKALLAPVNAAELGTSTAQIVGLLTTLAVCIGLVFSRRERRAMLFASALWMALALVPVLNLFTISGDLRNNRLLFLVSAGYCVGLAVLLQTALATLADRQQQALATALVASLLLAGAITSWLQMRPWQVATTQVNAIDSELRRLIPPTRRPQGMVWYVEGRPALYRGVYTYINGLGNMRHFTTGDTPDVQDVSDAKAADLLSDSRDSFAMRFDLYKRFESYHVGYVAGITQGGQLPLPGETGPMQMVWDFTRCAPNALAQWQAVSANLNCQLGKGLVVQPASSDPQIIGPDLHLLTPVGESSYLRVRVTMSYPRGESSGPLLEWFWRASDNDWSSDRSRRMTLKADGKPHTYWTFIDNTEMGREVSGLRLDPITTRDEVEIEWIAIDMVE
jgi:hypothetical protein